MNISIYFTNYITVKKFTNWATVNSNFPDLDFLIRILLLSFDNAKREALNQKNKKKSLLVTERWPLGDPGGQNIYFCPYI